MVDINKFKYRADLSTEIIRTMPTYVDGDILDTHEYGYGSWLPVDEMGPEECVIYRTKAPCENNGYYREGYFIGRITHRGGHLKEHYLGGKFEHVSPREARKIYCEYWYAFSKYCMPKKKYDDPDHIDYECRTCSAYSVFLDRGGYCKRCLLNFRLKRLESLQRAKELGHYADLKLLTKVIKYENKKHF